MSCVNLVDILKKASAGSYAVGAFNILDYLSMKAAVEAAEQRRSPIILQTGTKTVSLWGLRAVSHWYRELAEAADVPAALHLDHCKDLDLIFSCIKEGWTSVMIDASSYPFEKNIELTRTVLERARPAGVSVEAELGTIAGAEDTVEHSTAAYTEAEEARSFLGTCSPDVFAPSIGTVHGLFTGKPKINYGLIRRISRENGVPLALHGGSGLNKDVFRRCIAAGCAKVNISTHLKHIYIDSFLQFKEKNKDLYEPSKLHYYQYEQLKKTFINYIDIFGCADKA